MNWIKQNKTVIICGGIAAALIVYLLFPFVSASHQEGQITVQSEGGEEPLQAAAPVSSVKENEKDQTMVVDVKGAVNHPGVYEANQGERVVDVIKKAGGIKETGDETSINFALKVTDEMVIYVPVKGEANIPASSASKEVAAPNGTQNDLVELNSATAADLETLPGIGPAKAAVIIEFRDANGGFSTKEDLKKITGIGEKTYEKLAELVTVK
ncbi:helix-hairpin-helix domain-containing protein [Niallia sp. 01092]|uniref:helix-hairpin-helix domain-containing protein n=1 Tax=unclassified Niallia TaxID=2837522 RepID=UPI003FD0BC6D